MYLQQNDNELHCFSFLPYFDYAVKSYKSCKCDFFAVTTCERVIFWI